MERSLALRGSSEGEPRAARRLLRLQLVRPWARPERERAPEPVRLPRAEEADLRERPSRSEKASACAAAGRRAAELRVEVLRPSPVLLRRSMEPIRAEAEQAMRLGVAGSRPEPMGSKAWARERERAPELELEQQQRALARGPEWEAEQPVGSLPEVA